MSRFSEDLAAMLERLFSSKLAPLTTMADNDGEQLKSLRSITDDIVNEFGNRNPCSDEQESCMSRDLGQEYSVVRIGDREGPQSRLSRMDRKPSGPCR